MPKQPLHVREALTSEPDENGLLAVNCRECGEVGRIPDGVLFGTRPFQRAETMFARHFKKVSQRADLDRALAIIRHRHPEATSATLVQADQGSRYGFFLVEITLADGRLLSDVDDDARLKTWDAVHQLICDLDWGCAVGEDEQGYATLSLPAAERTRDAPLNAPTITVTVQGDDEPNPVLEALNELIPENTRTVEIDWGNKLFPGVVKLEVLHPDGTRYEPLVTLTEGSEHLETPFLVPDHVAFLPDAANWVRAIAEPRVGQPTGRVVTLQYHLDAQESRAAFVDMLRAEDDFFGDGGNDERRTDIAYADGEDLSGALAIARQAGELLANVLNANTPAGARLRGDVVGLDQVLDIAAVLALLGQQEAGQDLVLDVGRDCRTGVEAAAQIEAHLRGL